MNKKTYKLFGIKILEIETLEGEGAIYKESKKPLFRKPAGSVLTYSPEEAERDNERELEEALEKR